MAICANDNGSINFFLIGSRVLESILQLWDIFQCPETLASSSKPLSLHGMFNRNQLRCICCKIVEYCRSAMWQVQALLHLLEGHKCMLQQETNYGAKLLSLFTNQKIWYTCYDLKLLISWLFWRSEKDSAGISFSFWWLNRCWCIYAAMFIMPYTMHYADLFSENSFNFPFAGAPSTN